MVQIAEKNGLLMRLHKLKVYYIDEMDEAKDLILMISRYVSCFVTLICLAVMMISQTDKNNQRIPVVVLDASAVDIFTGLYKAVGDTFNSNADLVFGEGLSTSQIIAITNVSTSMLMDTPDYIASGLYFACKHTTYNWRYANPDEKSSGLYKVSPLDHGANDLTTTEVGCTKARLYDYHKVMDKSFDLFERIIFSEGSFNTPTQQEGNQFKQEQAEYNKWRKARERILRPIPGMLIFLVIIQPFLLVSIGLYYRFKRLDQHGKALQILGNLMAAGSILLLGIASYCLIAMYVALTDFKKRVNYELADFKISLKLGGTWFSLLWVTWVSLLVFMACWTIPTWFKTPPEEERTVVHDLEDIEGSDESDHLKRSYSCADDTSFNDKSFQIPTMSTLGLKKESQVHKVNSLRSSIDENDILIDVPFKDD